ASTRQQAAGSRNHFFQVTIVRSRIARPSKIDWLLGAAPRPPAVRPRAPKATLRVPPRLGREVSRCSTRQMGGGRYRGSDQRPKGRERARNRELPYPRARTLRESGTYNVRRFSDFVNATGPDSRKNIIEHY